MRKLIAALAVLVAIILAALLSTRSAPPADDAAHPQLDTLLRQCDATGSSLGIAYTKVSEHMREYLTLDRHTALAAARGQIANLIDGRLAVCERALAVAEHDRRSSALVSVGPVVERLKRAHGALAELMAALQAGSDAAAAKLDALEDAMHGSAH